MMTNPNYQVAIRILAELVLEEISDHDSVIAHNNPGDTKGHGKGDGRAYQGIISGGKEDTLGAPQRT